MCLQNLSEEVPGSMEYVTKHENLSKEPKSNWKQVEYIMPAESFPVSGGEAERMNAFDQMRTSSSSRSFRRGSSLAKSFRQSISKLGNGVLVDLVLHSERPTELHSIYDLEDNEVSFDDRSGRIGIFGS